MTHRHAVRAAAAADPLAVSGAAARRFFCLVPLLAAAAAMQGCGGPSKYLGSNRSAEGSLFVAFLEFEDSPWDQVAINWRDANGELQGEFARMDGKGLVYLENVPAGAIYIDHGFFAGYNWSQTFELSKDPRTNPTTCHLPRPGVCFAGSFRYRDVDDEKGRPSFELVRVGSPKEKEVLERLLPYARETPWEEMIRRRIQRL